MLSPENTDRKRYLFLTNVKDGSITVTRSNDVIARAADKIRVSLNFRGGTTVATSALEIVFYAGVPTM